MFSVEANGKKTDIKRQIDFEKVYFYLVRTKGSATGYSGRAKVFELVDGTEHVDEKASLFAPVRAHWRKPTRAELEGALGQFKVVSDLARLVGVARSTVTVWQKRAGNGGVTFYVWRYICECMGVRQEIQHGLEMREYKLP